MDVRSLRIVGRPNITCLNTQILLSLIQNNKVTIENYQSKITKNTIAMDIQFSETDNSYNEFQYLVKIIVKSYY
jgi:hypothetical protein